MYDHSVLAHEPDSDFLEIRKLKLDNGVLMGGKNDIMYDPINELEDRDEDLLHTENQTGDEFRKLPDLSDLIDDEGNLNGRNNETGDYRNPFIDSLYDDKLSQEGSELYNDFSDYEDVGNGLINKAGDYTNPFTDPNYDGKFSEREVHIYTDKSVMECEMPELIVCFKEGNCNGIKDIGIDEGRRSDNKVLIENLTEDANKLESENGDRIFTSRDDKLIFSDEVKIEKITLIQECHKPIQETCVIGRDELQEKTDKLPHLDEKDENLYTGSDDKVKPDSEVVAENCNSNSSQEPFYIDSDERQCQLDQVVLETGQHTSSSTPVAEEESNNCNQASEIPSQSETANETVTSDVDTLPSGLEDENTHEKCVQKPLEDLMRFGFEEELKDSKIVSNRSILTQQGYGESSFSSVGPISGPLSYSGAVPCSGSISYRSDSSTTSARSFAFPVLNTEWNSSPVKMMKADKRHYRKHRGWRLWFFCCRF